MQTSSRPGYFRRDGLLILLVGVLSASLYVTHLGLYSDDWDLFAYLATGPDQSFFGLIRRITTAWYFNERPAYALYVAASYGWFGLSPPGYHLVTNVTIVLGALLLYCALREFGEGRLAALAVALVYLLLPHYSTDRFWFAASHVPFSTAGYFLSLYASLRAGSRPGGAHLRWHVIAMTSLVFSVLNYEVFMPLFLLNPFLVCYRRRQLTGTWALTPSSGALIFAPTLALTVGAGLLKRLSSSRWLAATLSDHVIWFDAFFRRAIDTAVSGDYGTGLPRVLARIMRDYPDPRIQVVSAATGLIVFGYLYRAAAAPEGDGLRPAAMARLFLAGIVVFAAGYSIFLVTFNASISSTGMTNRIAMAAALGIALAAVGALGFVCAWLPPGRGRRALFCAGVAAACAAGCVILNTLAQFWVVAGERQSAILADIRLHVPKPPPGATLLLQGFCPYVGPGPVLETSWDTAGALGFLYGDFSLRGDVVTPKLTVAPEGIYTRMYGQPIGPYPFVNLFLYDFDRKSLQPVPGPYAARRVLVEARGSLTPACPPAQDGVGIEPFTQGPMR